MPKVKLVFQDLEYERAHLQVLLSRMEAEQTCLTVQIKVSHDQSVLVNSSMCNYLLLFVLSYIFMSLVNDKYNCFVLPLFQTLERTANHQKSEMKLLTEQLARLKQQTCADPETREAIG